MELIELLTTHIRKHRIHRVRDVYKLLYQGTLGNAHFMTINMIHARNYLKHEMKFLPGGFRQPLIEEISTDGQFVRINLSPYKWYGFDIDDLLYIMKRSAQITFPLERFLDQWYMFREFIIAEELEFEVAEFEEFEAEMKEENYPAVRHSEQYVNKNKPAYRVVSKDLFLQHYGKKWGMKSVGIEGEEDILDDDWYLNIE